jgi:hypothetical protein
VSQAIFLAFEDGFPLSIVQFTPEFQDNMATDIFDILAGLHPSQPVCDNWEKKHENIPKIVEGNALKYKMLGNLLISKKHIDVPIDLDDLNDNSNIKHLFDLDSKLSSVIGDIRRSKPTPFNIYRKSPMVEHFLSTYGQGVVSNRNLKIRRNELIVSKPIENARTYRNVIQESQKTSKDRYSKFKFNVDVLTKDRNKIVHDSYNSISIETEKVAKMLAKPSSIKITADYIIELHNDRSRNRTGAFVRAPLFE